MIVNVPTGIAVRASPPNSHAENGSSKTLSGKHRWMSWCWRSHSRCIQNSKQKSKPINLCKAHAVGQRASVNLAYTHTATRSQVGTCLEIGELRKLSCIAHVFWKFVLFHMDETMAHHNLSCRVKITWSGWVSMLYHLQPTANLASNQDQPRSIHITQVVCS